MAGEKVERTPHGDVIYRHTDSKPFEPAFDNPDVEQIQGHVDKYIGKVESAFHEFISNFVHIDILLVKPSPQRNFYTLVTSGMSQRPMKTPPGVQGCEYAELLICLPPDWPMTDAAMKDESNYWPLRWLRILACFPHEYDSWLWYGHTIPNGDPARPFAKNTGLAGIILAPPLLVPKEFGQLEINETKTIQFFSILPIYAEEMSYKLDHGADSLFDRMDQQKINELVDIDRPSVCKRSLWPKI